MADQDESQKTEQPTEKKLADALKKGDVAKSQEISNWFVLAAATVVVAFMSGTMAKSISTTMIPFFSEAHLLFEHPRGLLGLTQDVGMKVVLAMALPLGTLVLAAIAGNVLQHPPVFTGERMKPKLDKISPMKGFKRIFGMNALVNFAKGIFKLVVIGAVAFLIMWPRRDQLGDVISHDLSVFFPFVRSLTLEMLGGVLAVLAVLAVLDFVYQKFDYTKRQRMTKQETKDEHKQAEGDPTVKAKLRQIRMERGRRRMMASVPEASVVVTNPTHYAVALKYETGGMAAPVCVAKGADNVALRIRTVAKEHDVPIVENPPLARALFDTVDIDDEVPPTHYKAVAQVIGYVMRLKGRAGNSRHLGQNQAS